MLIVLLDWIYIFFITQLFGFGFFKFLNKHIKTNLESGIIQHIVCGIALSTIYTQFFSLFYKIGLIANLLLLVCCVIIFIKHKNELISLFKGLVKLLTSWQGMLYIGILLLIAFFTSRGAIHADTNMYHAQAIRWYEEYGIVKGLANLQWHFAYNSSYFAFASLFSMGFLLPQPLHCTTGFIFAIFCIWAIKQLSNFFTHTRHISDMCCIGILLYALVNLTGCISPASDYPTMLFSLYLITRWAQEIENSKDNIFSYCMLSVLSVFIFTLKMSAGLLVLLTLYPAVHLVKKKKIKEILIYISLGIITLIPFLIRNFIISGWLLYPFPTLDLFSVDWKLPIQYVIIDSNQLKTWARCLYDAKLINTPMSEWIPIWWNSQERYAQMLILTNILAIILDASIVLHTLINKSKINWNIVLLNICTILSAIAWFFLASFIRYGLAFLIAIPMLSVGMWMRKEKSSFYKLFSGCLVTLMFFILTPYWDHYFTDDTVFIKQNLMQPYYIVQKDYESSEMEVIKMNNIDIYTPKTGETTGYKYFPCSSYDYMITNTELRGSDIKEGFRNTEFQ